MSRGLGRWVNGDIQGGLRDLETSARLLPVNDETLGSLKALAMTIYIASSERDYRTALLRAEELDKLSAQIGWKEGRVFATYVVADIHYALRDFAVARDLYERVRKTGTQVHTSFNPSAWLEIASCDLALGRAARAEQ